MDKLFTKNGSNDGEVGGDDEHTNGEDNHRRTVSSTPALSSKPSTSSFFAPSSTRRRQGSDAGSGFKLESLFGALQVDFEVWWINYHTTILSFFPLILCTKLIDGHGGPEGVLC